MARPLAAGYRDPMEIDDATRAHLLRYGFDEAQLARFAARVRDAAGPEPTQLAGPIEPTTPEELHVLPAPGTPAHARLAERGAAALRAREVGVVILAGGMATRFGGVVKASVPVIEGRSFLALKLADVVNVGAAHGAPVPAFVMTSYATDDAIVAQLAREQLAATCFPQHVSLRLTPTGELFREADGALSPYATGHGDLTFALRESGVLAGFRAAGGKLLYMSNVDNLVATLDPAVLGAHLERGVAITAEVVRKAPGDRGGAPARVGGVPQIVEAFRFPPAFDQDTIPLFNTNSFVFDAAAIDRDFDLTYFRTQKHVGDATAVQFERLVGQLTAFLPTQFLEVPRDGVDGRFQPVKDPEEMAARLPAIERILRAHRVL